MEFVFMLIVTTVVFLLEAFIVLMILLLGALYVYSVIDIRAKQRDAGRSEESDGEKKTQVFCRNADTFWEGQNNTATYEGERM